MNTRINRAVFNRFPGLRTTRLFLREVRDSDASDLFQIRSSSDAMRYMDSKMHSSLAESEQMLQSMKAMFYERKGINWIINDQLGNQVLGYCGYWKLDETNCRAEIGYALKPTFWGQGFMEEALRACIGFAFKQLQLHSLEANVNPANKKSIRLLKKLYFQKEAYFRENYFFNGQFLDSEIYALLETDWEGK
jgi:ribosomal-protein-alanine N-acetyltransferase